MARRRVPLAVRLAGGIMMWLVLLYLAVETWDEFVEATGDTLDECDRGRCGALGEFTDDHPLILLSLFLAGAAIPAAALTWLLGRLFHSSDDQPERRPGA
jgi:hypothetical protein